MKMPLRGAPAGWCEGTNLERAAAPGSAAPGTLQEGGWAGGLPSTGGLLPGSDPAGSSSARLGSQTETQRERYSELASVSSAAIGHVLLD